MGCQSERRVREERTAPEKQLPCKVKSYPATKTWSIAIIDEHSGVYLLFI